jgi:hypothetical protein
MFTTNPARDRTHWSKSQSWHRVGRLVLARPARHLSLGDPGFAYQCFLNGEFSRQVLEVRPPTVLSFPSPLHRLASPHSDLIFFLPCCLLRARAAHGPPSPHLAFSHCFSFLTLLLILHSCFSAHDFPPLVFSHVRAPELS